MLPKEERKKSFDEVLLFFGKKDYLMCEVSFDGLGFEKILDKKEASQISKDITKGDYGTYLNVAIEVLNRIREQEEMKNYSLAARYSTGYHVMVCSEDFNVLTISVCGEYQKIILTKI